MKISEWAAEATRLALAIEPTHGRPAIAITRVEMYRTENGYVALIGARSATTKPDVVWRANVSRWTSVDQDPESAMRQLLSELRRALDEKIKRAETEVERLTAARETGLHLVREGRK